MKDYIKKRAILFGEYIVITKSTIRETADHFKADKSTVAKDVLERLYEIDRNLAEEVKKIMEINKSQRHIRGGKATRKRWSMQNE